MATGHGAEAADVGSGRCEEPFCSHEEGISRWREDSVNHSCTLAATRCATGAEFRPGAPAKGPRKPRSRAVTAAASSGILHRLYKADSSVAS